MRRVLVGVASPRLIELGKQGRRVARGLGELESIYPVLARGPAELMRWVFDRCNGIYPNSRWEAEGLRKYISPERIADVEVVPNGVDIGLLERGWTGDAFRERWGIEYDKFVLCVARFDERKNNLALIRAALEAEVPCVMVGRPAPLHVGYFDRCKREAEAGGRIRIIDEPLSQEQLTGAYRAAHAHALPSWLETPGLVSLEAALCGANLVLGECPPVREYFGSSAWYCNPGDVSSIATALRSAYMAERNLYDIDDLVRRKYSWRQVALRQLECYERALGSRAMTEVEAVYDHS
jgi:glycosyltransferase involved in cell wall biosynthesis